ncbi:hypothetical protein GGE06_005485 [Streptomyces sp. SFB5A]|uniref:Xaa-Pro dipeptidyl-peptidase C-terminal domain-containing protein n=1 Tax=Streptomyces nymphaeiformis TaxID=2663842 RepID=A0A7W7U3Z9_9ACTN|nr:hypothetical protein [Streptomyces nymphaeiformis]
MPGFLSVSRNRWVSRRRPQPPRGSRRYGNWLIPTSHSESSLAGTIGLPDPRPYDTPGTYLGWTSAPLTAPADLVGAPRATLRVVSPATERVQDSGDAADKLVLFAKLYDVAPDGTKTLINRLVAPVRVPDVTQPFTVELPGIVHRYETGHRLEFVVAASDTAYSGNRGIKPVTVVSDPEDTGSTGTLSLPLVEGRVGQSAAYPGRTTSSISRCRSGSGRKAASRAATVNSSKTSGPYPNASTMCWNSSLMVVPETSRLSVFSVMRKPRRRSSSIGCEA